MASNALTYGFDDKLRATKVARIRTVDEQHVAVLLEGTTDLKAPPARKQQEVVDIGLLPPITIIARAVYCWANKQAAKLTHHCGSTPGQLDSWGHIQHRNVACNRKTGHIGYHRNGKQEW